MSRRLRKVCDLLQEMNYEELKASIFWVDTYYEEAGLVPFRDYIRLKRYNTSNEKQRKYEIIVKEIL